MKLSKLPLILISVISAVVLARCATINQITNKINPPTTSNQIKASGTISTIHIRLSPEISGKIIDIPVEKGESVNAGDVVFKLDDRLLSIQRTQAAAAIPAAELGLLNAQKALNDLKDNANLAAAQAQVTLATANNSLDNAQKKQVSIQLDRASTEDLENVRAQYTLAQKVVDAAQKVYDKLSDRPETDPTRAQATVNLQAAKTKRDTIKSNLDWLLGFPTDLQVGEREANLALALAQVDKAQKDYEARKNGPDPDDLALAEANVRNAEAQLQQARSALDQMDLTLEKTIVTAPASGVILDIPLNIGEMATAGATVVEIGNLEKVTLTVYIPEDQYGKIYLGQTVNVSVDSFPGKVFEGNVTYISDQAEFTPRNVQTTESRSTTVYAIEISLDNPEQDLKPGMPADSVFNP
jgi:HlyD family secretion protein